MMDEVDDTKRSQDPGPATGNPNPESRQEPSSQGESQAGQSRSPDEIENVVETRRDMVRDPLAQDRARVARVPAEGEDVLRAQPPIDSRTESYPPSGGPNDEDLGSRFGTNLPREIGKQGDLDVFTGEDPYAEEPPRS